MKCILVGSFHFRAPNESNLGKVILFEGDCIKFAKLCPLMSLMHVCEACFPFYPLCLYSVGRSWHALCGCPMKHIGVGLFPLRADVSNFLSCDSLSALCKFVWPICHFLP